MQMRDLAKFKRDFRVNKRFDDYAYIISFIIRCELGAARHDRGRSRNLQRALDKGRFN